MKYITRYISVLLSLLYVTSFAQWNELPNFAASILPGELQRHVQILAADSLQGRQTGTDAALKAADYIAQCFAQHALQPPYDSSFFQAFVSAVAGVNVVGIIEGTDLKDQAVVLSAHYDHVGMYDNQIYNGADDNASGVAALLEIAQAFTAMARNNYRPRRTLVFIAFDAKEKNMAGSAYYADHPLHPMWKTIANLNIDAIGRVEGSHNGQANYLLLVGAERLSSDLRTVTDRVLAERNIGLSIDYSFYNSEVFSDLFYLFSDQYHFGKHYVPVIYYTGGLHDDLYKPSDTEEKINYTILRKRAQLIFYTAWELANSNNWPKIDLLKKQTSKK
jgi:hypothetical protein